MSVFEKPGARSAVPVLPYRDIGAASTWLCAAFGFEPHADSAASADASDYAELSFGDAMVILIRDARLGDATATSPLHEGREAQSAYFVVDDVDAHFARASAAGAVIVSTVADMANGGRGYVCRDDEGHVWSFGTYDPWHGRRVPGPPACEPEVAPRGRKRWALASGLGGIVVASAVAAAWINDADLAGTRVSAVTSLSVETDEELLRERGAREVAEQKEVEARDRASSEEEARIAAEQKAHELSEQLQEAEQARVASERSAAETSKALAKERSARESLGERSQSLAKELTQERSAKESAEQAAAALRQELARSQSAGGEASKAEQSASELRMDVARSQSSSEASERARKEAQELLDRETQARAAAERAAEEARQLLSAEQSAKEAADRAAEEARAALDAERSAKSQAYRAIATLRKQLAQSQGGQSGVAESELVAPPPKPAQRPSKSGTASAAAKDPQYNGPLSPF